jgi:hypothetical protein
MKLFINNGNFNNLQAKSARDADELLQSEVDFFNAIPKQVIIYCDTLGVAYQTKPPPEISRSLSVMADKASFTYNQKSKYWEIEINRPSEAALKVLGNAPGHHVVNKLHFAVDFIPSNPADIPVIYDFLKRRVTMPWRGHDREVGSCGATVYAAARHSKRNAALYADRVSKRALSDCVHWEVRWKTADTCRRLGVSKVSDLLRFDPISSISRQFRLSRLFLKPVAAAMKRRSPQNLRAERLLSVRIRSYLNGDDAPPNLQEAEKLLPMQAWLDSRRVWSGLPEGAVHHAIAPILSDAQVFPLEP